MQGTVEILPGNFSDVLTKGKTGIADDLVNPAKPLHRHGGKGGGAARCFQIAEHGLGFRTGLSCRFGDGEKVVFFLTILAAPGMQHETGSGCGNTATDCRPDATGGTGNQDYAVHLFVSCDGLFGGDGKRRQLVAILFVEFEVADNVQTALQMSRIQFAQRLTQRTSRKTNGTHQAFHSNRIDG